MANIGSGNGSGYPAVLDTQNIKEVDDPAANRTLARAAVPNDLAAAIIAIETTLGTNPQVNAAGTQKTMHVVQDSVTLTNGTATVTLAGPGAYSSATSYVCIVQNDDSVYIVQNSGSSITFTGIGSATIRYFCIGN